MNRVLFIILKLLAQLMLARNRPKIIVVTGSVGKTSTKNAISTILSDYFPVRKSYQSYNNQIGVPLTILGFKTPGKNLFAWLRILLFSIGRIIISKNYPQILVLEMGADRKGDLEYLASFVRPVVVVITKIGSSHLEYFGSKDELLKEKISLLKFLDKKDKVVLNFDDKRLRKVGLKLANEVIFFGFEEGANFRAENFKQKKDQISFILEAEGNSLPISLPVVGRAQVYNILAGIAVGRALGIDLVNIAKSIRKYQAERGRVKLLAGIKGLTIIDDSYNSSPESAQNSLEVLAEIAADNRKVAVLGDMLELGKISRKAHYQIGRRAAQIVDLLIFVGRQAKIMAKAARKERSPQVLWFKDHQSLEKKILSLVKRGDIILIKGSQGVRLEKVVAKLLSKKLVPENVLVRQSKEWQKR